MRMPENPPRPLRDAHGREVRYLRFSVTDRCNLRCMYCRNTAEERFIPHTDVLRYEEMLGLVRVASGLGVEKVRLTGGEPFVRRGFMGFVETLRSDFPSLDVRITTNGTLLRPYVAALHAAGVRTINISCDSLTPATFAAITGTDALHEVRAGLDAALAAGLRCKINVVALRGINDHELPDIVDFARRHPVDVRYIEFMPMGGGTRWSDAHYWPASDILAAATCWADLLPVPRADANGGPARMYAIAGGQGRFGIITPMSEHFCGACNRLRVTSDGHLRTCLFADKEYSLRGILRHPRLGEAHLRRVLASASAVKPIGADILQARRQQAVTQKRMTSIGG